MVKKKANAKTNAKVKPKAKPKVKVRPKMKSGAKFKAKKTLSPREKSEITTTESGAQAFSRRLILASWAMSYLGFRTLEEIKILLNKPHLEGIKPDGVHGFFLELSCYPGLRISKEMLAIFEQNVLRHTKAINSNRHETVTWKYFQWVSLILTEIYLSKYTSNRNALLDELNVHVRSYNGKISDVERVEEFSGKEINKLAFWCATGSGKTLLMHVNILQYRHWVASAPGMKLSKIILLTPNAGLSKQHQDEFEASGIRSRVFQTAVSIDGLLSEELVDILTIHQLSNTPGPDTVHPDSFEGNNLVLVDEGHRGTGADATWLRHRRTLCAGGFSFEYSATFGQAIGEGNNENLKQEYIKSILFDYSYKHFYSDGYGKDYQILNLTDVWDESSRRLYLTGCLLTYFQQLIIFKDKAAEIRPFNIEKPLLAFVGASVNAVRNQSGQPVSDVLDVLLFLSTLFEGDTTRITNDIRIILDGESGLSVNKSDVFSSSFEFLKTKYPHDVQALYKSLLVEVFQSHAPGKLHLERLKADGEIGLKVGLSGDYFGVINIGDVGEFLKLCIERDSLVVLDKSQFSSSLFESVNRIESPVNVVIGSKKFVEGWNCWRVCTMGLLHVGRSAGSEIIQLFGRGIRLRGYNSSLTRSSRLNMAGVRSPEFIEELETLKIFGVKADYMATFRDYLKSEGVAVDDVRIEFKLPTIRGFTKGTQLKTLRLNEKYDYLSSGESPSLAGDVPDQIKSRPIPLNWYKTIQKESSQDDSSSRGPRHNEAKLDLESHLAFINWEKVWFELLQYRTSRGFHQLQIPRGAARALFEDPSWYRLQIPEAMLEPKKFSDLQVFQEIVECLLKKYAERYYKYGRSEWEGQYLEYVKIEEADENFVTEYRILLEGNADELLEKLEKIKVEISENKLPTAMEYGNLEVISDLKHMYHPLLHLKDGEGLKGVIEVSPAALNAGERNFVGDLTDYYKGNLARFSGREVFLIRNRGRGRGVGFFEAGNFYPDFILWIVQADKQIINFVDPHGLVHSDGLSDPKIMFSTVIKEKQERLKSLDPLVELNSFIVSVTPYDQIALGGLKGTKAEFEGMNVLFQIDDKNEYIGKMFDIALKEAL